ncbi:hypothetical protein ID062_00525 [Vibrio cholerae]|uniref:hypothetical protein n=1 Tax=Vibrio cholerae TaxID=666 RepID=UPI001D9171C9|nr:hypothetical protein [Vibrio cholerae]EKF9755070.1 hypothetical protein [Vibrio cholerae]
MSKKSIAALLGIGLVSIGLLYQFWGREFIAQDRCLDAGGAYQQATQSCDHSMDDIAYDAFDGVIYRGVVDGKSVSLESIGHGDGYRMSVDGQVTLGELNTERGFEQDENASLFILNWRQPEIEQIKWVKLSSDHQRLVLVDKDGKLDTAATLVATDATSN